MTGSACRADRFLVRPGGQKDDKGRSPEEGKGLPVFVDRKHADFLLRLKSCCQHGISLLSR